MSIARFAREKKRQLGQFFTPAHLAQAIVNNTELSPEQKILEPSFGDGAFIFALINNILPTLRENTISQWCNQHLYGCELDKIAYARLKQKWQTKKCGLTTQLRCGIYRAVLYEIIS